MKRFAVAVVTLLLTVGVVGGTASAEGEAQTFLFNCALLDGNGNFVTTIGVGTHYASGKSTIRCEKNGVANPSGAVVVWTYENTRLLCGIPGAGSTTEWRNRVGANGQAQLTCETWRKEGQIEGAAAATGGLG